MAAANEAEGEGEIVMEIPVNASIVVDDNLTARLIREVDGPNISASRSPSVDDVLDSPLEVAGNDVEIEDYDYSSLQSLESDLISDDLDSLGDIED